jgi:hypothetical protein
LVPSAEESAISRGCAYALPRFSQRAVTASGAARATLHSSSRFALRGVMKTGRENASAICSCTFLSAACASGTSRMIMR